MQRQPFDRIYGRDGRRDRTGSHFRCRKSRSIRISIKKQKQTHQNTSTQWMTRQKRMCDSFVSCADG